MDAAAPDAWVGAFPEVPDALLSEAVAWGDAGLSLERSNQLGWGTALLTAMDGRPPPAGGAPAGPPPTDRAAPVDWRSLMRSGELERLCPEAAGALPLDEVAGATGRLPLKRARGGGRAAASGGGRRAASAAAAAVAPPPPPAPVARAPSSVDAKTESEGGADMTDRAADRARAIQTKNRENQRRHRERQRSKLAAAEDRVASLTSELDTSRAEVEKLLARVVAAERGGAPRAALTTLYNAHARLRALLRGLPHAAALRSVESMHLSELVQDRRQLCEAVAALVDDPTHTDEASAAGQRLAALLSARHDTVRGFFNSALKPMHMMFAAYERHDNATGCMANLAKWFHTIRGMGLSPAQADALVSARDRYIATLDAAARERADLKSRLEATEPSRDTFGARSLRQLTAASAAEAFVAVVDREDRAALDLELAAIAALSHAQYAVAFLAAGPSMPDWLCVANLLANDPARGSGSSAAGGATAAAGGAGGDGGGRAGGRRSGSHATGNSGYGGACDPTVAEKAAADAARADAAAGGAAARVI